MASEKTEDFWKAQRWTDITEAKVSFNSFNAKKYAIEFYYSILKDLEPMQFNDISTSLMFRQNWELLTFFNSTFRRVQLGKVSPKIVTAENGRYTRSPKMMYRLLSNQSRIIGYFLLALFNFGRRGSPISIKLFWNCIFTSIKANTTILLGAKTDCKCVSHVKM